MLGQIIVKVLQFVLTTLTLTSARPGHSTPGTNFVIPYPFHNDNKFHWSVHITTLEEQVKANIILKDMICRYVVKRHQHVRYDLSPNPDTQLNGIFPAIKLNSSGPMRVFVNVAHKIDFDAFRVFPKDSSYSSYYITVVPMESHIAVLSFDEPTTEVSVTFPPRTGLETFRVHCSADAICEPGKTVNFQLEPYKSWLFYLETPYDLQNTLVASDKQIYVIAGSDNCTNVQTFHDSKICISSMKPTEAWGKTYVVPHNTLAEKVFRVNSKTFPFSITVNHGKDSNFKVTFRNHKEFLNLGANLTMLVFKSDVPFGLYQIFSAFSNGRVYPGFPGKPNDNAFVGFDTSILNLIPVEQWRHGNVFHSTGIEDFHDITFSMSFLKMSAKDVIFADAEKNPKWIREDSTTIDGVTFSSGDVDLSSIQNTRIYTKTPAGRMMLYIQIGKRIKLKYIYSNFPFDFYQGKIYNSSCEKQEKFGPNDGVDNDCDGFVDEEYENGKDDDGDGQIDEDFVERNKDGQWGPWRSMCQQKCLDKTLDVRGRACLKQSGFGRFCKGEDILCDGKACPAYCSYNNRPNTECYCGVCDQCKHEFFKCSRCKPGVLSTLHCTTPCPRGWTGLGCTFSEPVEKLFRTTEHSISWIPFIVVVAVVVSLLVIGGGVYLKVRSRKYDNIRRRATKASGVGSIRRYWEGADDTLMMVKSRSSLFSHGGKESPVTASINAAQPVVPASGKDKHQANDVPGMQSITTGIGSDDHQPLDSTGADEI